jgi:hypothetical protein
VLLELGRQAVKLQWSSATWKAILGYRPWPPPAYDAPAALRLVQLAEPIGAGEIAVCQTRQFRLLRAGEPHGASAGR